MAESRKPLPSGRGAVTAIWPYASYRQFRSGKTLLAVLALCVFAVYTDIGTFECYSALS